MKFVQMFLPFVVAGILFSACGDESVTENTVEKVGVEIVSSMKDLPECDAESKGSQYLVKDGSSLYTCDGDKWISLVNSNDYGCETKANKDSTGLIIYCAGDSIGIVLNGADGADGANGTNGVNGKDGVGKPGTDGEDGDGCKVVESKADSVTIKCGEDQFVMYLGAAASSSSTAKGESSSSGEEAEKVGCDENGDGECSVEDVELEGASQKGPFMKSTAVTAYELENGKTLKQTGNSYRGSIERDDGLFNIKTVKLESQYVYLVADGFYRNEVSGKASENSIRLTALANLKRKNVANINLVTHLEYNRLVELVTKQGMTVTNAKKQAEKEIFSAFYMEGLKYDGFAEDLNILKVGSGNAALLAISVLLQGERPESEMLALLAETSVDLADGKWDGSNAAKTRAKIADWAEGVYLGKNESKITVSSIEENIKGWKLSDEVPDFGEFLYNFFVKEYGLGTCDAEHKNVMVNDTASLSMYSSKGLTRDGNKDLLVRFICDESTLHWREATEHEKNTYQWTAGENGEVRNGLVDDHSVYVFENGQWRVGTEIDSLMYKNEGYACTAEHAANHDTSEVKLNDRYFACIAGDDEVAYRWVDAGEFYNDTYEARSECRKEGKYGDGTILEGRVNPDNKYVCDEAGFKPATEDDILVNKGCTSFTSGALVFFPGWYSYHSCYGSQFYWRSVIESYHNQGTFIDTRDNHVYGYIGIGKQLWMSQNLNYDYKSNVNDGHSYSACYGNSKTNCDKYGRLYNWYAAMDVEQQFGNGSAGCDWPSKDCDSTTIRRGVCPVGWHLPSRAEWQTLIDFAEERASIVEPGRSGVFYKLKSYTTDWVDYEDEYGRKQEGYGRDEFKFTLLPAGQGTVDFGDIYFHGSLGDLTGFWTSTSLGDGVAYNVRIFNDNGVSFEDWNGYEPLFSVRCVKDPE